MNKSKTYWFSHDMNAHEDSKIKALMSIWGAEGYGWYWIIVEVMAQQKGYKISTQKKYDFPSLALSLPNCSTEKCKEFVDDCINEFELFKSDGKNFWSTSLIERMTKHDMARERGKNAAAARWQKSKDKKESQEDTIFPEIQKEIDPAKVKSIQVLHNPDYFNLFCNQLLESENFKHITRTQLKNKRDELIDYLNSKGKKYKDYRSFFRGCLRRDFPNPGEIDLKTDRKMVM
tara:strand:+ start:29279 stop:29974 length:696 start_codon:yes stop_codon:yes gene_type:complete